MACFQAGAPVSMCWWPGCTRMWINQQRECITVNNQPCTTSTLRRVPAVWWFILQTDTGECVQLPTCMVHARSRSTGFLACTMIKRTPRCDLGLQYQPSNTWHAFDCAELQEETQFNKECARSRDVLLFIQSQGITPEEIGCNSICFKLSDPSFAKLLFWVIDYAPKHSLNMKTVLFNIVTRHTIVILWLNYMWHLFSIVFIHSYKVTAAATADIYINNHLSTTHSWDLHQ